MLARHDVEDKNRRTGVESRSRVQKRRASGLNGRIDSSSISLLLPDPYVEGTIELAESSCSIVSLVGSLPARSGSVSLVDCISLGGAVDSPGTSCWGRFKLQAEGLPGVTIPYRALGRNWIKQEFSPEKRHSLNHMDWEFCNII